MRFLTAIKTILLSGLLLSGIILTAQKPLPPRSNPPKLVNDFAGLLAPSEATILEKKLIAYNDSTSTQIAIVIENTLNGDDIFDYCQRLADAWGIGQKGKDNGILIYVAFDDRKIRIHTGYGVEGFLPDLMANRIISQVIVPAFRKGKYYNGLDKATNIIADLASGEYTADDMSSGEGGIPAEVIFFIIIFIIVLIIIINNADSGGGYNRGGRYERDRGGGWVILGPGSGGWHHSGGGGFSGGGFGGFGGGGFGGGGASGGW